MYRPISRVIARPSALRALPRASAPVARFLSTAPPTRKSRSWKSLAARLGLGGVVIYYYNNTEVFAEEPSHAVHSLPETDLEAEKLPTIEAIAQERERRKAEADAVAQEVNTANAQRGARESTGAEATEEEEGAGQQGAFNPETGEINWDCPCLGGMADGPCGEEFKAAFSCFIYSTEEPKGMDCVDKFKGMQTCFREYPEVYGSELEGDEEDDMTTDEADIAPEDSASTPDSTPAAEAPAPQSSSKPHIHQQSQRDLSLVPESARDDNKPKETANTGSEQPKKEIEPTSESEELIPKAAFNTTSANEEKKQNGEGA
ncbi:hypothetical protein BDV95DRAFT_574741 [Massariosphaeria phaeospora]|uniref:Mitochondrial intermembrane space import and assembly protein 40 n=1 Tax=Massariosphaeria phaeospora TaxID=100035 RepID=A0A7C8I4U7_9PLEO|nr:hypothetical protein BDV95DRAFT_574741 [Massariosphaeria phaeospora]